MENLNHLKAEIHARIYFRGKMEQSKFFETSGVTRAQWNAHRLLKFEMQVLNTWRGRVRTKKTKENAI